MSREIKFRVWDKANKQMKVVNQLDFLYEKSQSLLWGMQGALTDVWINNENESYIPIDTKLLQYTGLHDKNGKEIYEGDAVRYENFTLEVRWIPGGFILWSPNTTVHLNCNGNLILKTIGNIYENPWLLNK